MAIRNFVASTAKNGVVASSTSGVDALVTAVDDAITAALAQEDIDASAGAEAAVGDIQTAVDALETAVTAASGVTVVLNGSLTVNQIKIAFENVLRTLAQLHGEYPEA